MHIMNIIFQFWNGRDRQLKKLEENGSLDIAANLEKLDRQNVSSIGTTAKLSQLPLNVLSHINIMFVQLMFQTFFSASFYSLHKQIGHPATWFGQN